MIDWNILQTFKDKVWDPVLFGVKEIYKEIETNKRYKQKWEWLISTCTFLEEGEETELLIEVWVIRVRSRFLESLWSALIIPWSRKQKLLLQSFPISPENDNSKNGSCHLFLCDFWIMATRHIMLHPWNMLLQDRLCSDCQGAVMQILVSLYHFGDWAIKV